jgi:cell division protein FtsX
MRVVLVKNIDQLLKSKFKNKNIRIYMKKTDSNTQSRQTIEPYDPQTPSEQLKMIQNLVRNKFLSRKNKIQTLLSVRRDNES